MKILFTRNAEKDMHYWQETNTKTYQRILSLLESIQQSPYRGIGKPEPLKHQLKGCYSRRINREHRLVYTVHDDNVIVIAAQYHY